MLTPALIAQITSHGEQACPNEACGLIVQRVDDVVVLPARNLSSSPKYTFILDPQALILASKVGTVLGVYHTHPYTSEAENAIDRAGCNQSKLPWYVYSLHTQMINVIEPNQETAPLLKRPFIWGVFDCFTLLRDYYLQTLTIDVPCEAPYEEDFWLRNGNYYVDRAERAGFVRVHDLRPHDVLLMPIRSPQNPNHAAILLPDGQIMHHLQGRLSCRDVYGGYYRKHTTHIYRHKELLS